MTTQQENILIVDDEDGIRRLLKHKFSGLGYQCIEARNASEALDVLRKNVVSLAILDVNMPGRTGLDVLPEIRASHPETAVIMATAVGDVGTVIQCMKLGAYDYITKPFDLTEITLSVNHALEKRRLELELKQYHEHLREMVDEQAGAIRSSFLNSVASLATALEAKDKYTSGHSQRVAGLSVALGKELGLPRETIETIRIAGMIHDIGKIGITEAVLNKPDHLTPEEYQYVMSHCEIGERILAPIVQDIVILQAVRHHHERYDGRGYPDGLSGDQIPLGARILAAADSFDAMTSARSYRGPMETQTIISEIKNNKGSQFDPAIADALLRIVGSSETL